MPGGREGGQEEGREGEMIRTENLAASTEYTQVGEEDQEQKCRTAPPQTKRIAEVLLERKAGGRAYTCVGDLLLAGVYLQQDQETVEAGLLPPSVPGERAGPGEA